MQLQHSKIVVTGGSLGIGKETARFLVEKGAQVIVTGRSKARLEKAAAEIGAIPLVFDISDLDSIPEKAAEVLAVFDGKIDALINNAGVGSFPTMGEMTKAHFETVFHTNVFGLALLTQEMVKVMQAQQSGTIINLGSTAAQRGFARGGVYAASKFAVRAMTQSWQAELRRDNIRVCLVNPSEVTTAFNNEERIEKAETAKKLRAAEIAHTIVSVLEMEDRGFIPEVTVWATNPWE